MAYDANGSLMAGVNYNASAPAQPWPARCFTGSAALHQTPGARRRPMHYRRPSAIARIYYLLYDHNC